MVEALLAATPGASPNELRDPFVRRELRRASIWLGLAAAMAIIAAILVFIPDVGAFVTGLLMTAVGFSAGFHTGLAALSNYVIVQTIDEYVVIHMVAQRTVDLPPALTLGAQILASALFGVLGLALADPVTALVKVALERSSERESARADDEQESTNEHRPA